MKAMKNIFNMIFTGRQHVCPRWACFTFDNFLRKYFHNPDAILSPYIKKGATVLDIGPGTGYFTIPMAVKVGSSGKVFAVDIQKDMLFGVHSKAVKAGLEDRIVLYKCSNDKIGINVSVNFCLAFWMLHEVERQPRFLSEISAILKVNGLLLIVEPIIHVSNKSFSEMIKNATDVGLTIIDRPNVFMSHSVLLQKKHL